jgi:hypothetical protein
MLGSCIITCAFTRANLAMICRAEHGDALFCAMITTALMQI